VAGVPSPRAGAEAPATRQSTMEAARATEVPARATEASVRGGGWRRGGGRGGRAHDVDGDLEEEEAVLFFLEVRSNLSRGRTPSGRGSNGSFLCSLGGANRAPPRVGQGAKGGRVHPNQPALIEGAAGGRKHGSSDERGLARRGEASRPARQSKRARRKLEAR
jgi:hypothetical protein